MADGHIPNLGELTEKEQAALFHEHFGKIASIDDEIALLNEERKAAKRIAKNAGFASEDINWALKARKAENTDAVVDALKRRFRIAGWMNFVPVGFQLDLFGGQTESERAYGKGAVASTFNRPANPASDGYEPDSEEWKAWLRGYHDAQADFSANRESAKEKLAALIADGMASGENGPEEAPPAVKAAVKRGRKKKLDA